MRRHLTNAGRVLLGLAVATVAGLPLVVLAGLPLWSAPAVGLIAIDVMH